MLTYTRQKYECTIVCFCFFYKNSRHNVEIEYIIFLHSTFYVKSILVNKRIKNLDTLSLNFTQNLIEKFLNLHTVHVYYTLCKWKKFSLTMRKCHTSHKRSASLFFVTPWQCDKSFYFDYKNIIVDDPESRWSGFWFTHYSLMNMS